MTSAFTTVTTHTKRDTLLMRTTTGKTFAANDNSQVLRKRSFKALTIALKRPLVITKDTKVKLLYSPTGYTLQNESTRASNNIDDDFKCLTTTTSTYVGDSAVTSSATSSKK